MRAIVRRESAVFLDRDCAEPGALGPGDLLVRPTLCGVGQADVAVARGDIPHEGVLGHQFVGVVESAGESPRANDLVGARIVADINVADTAGELARRGLANHDPGRQVVGLRGRDGCFADRVVIPARNTARVPDGVTDDVAVFAEPVAAALHAGQITRLEGKNYVTVIGDNLSGLLCALVMTTLNQSVRLLGSRADRLRIAEKWGVRHRPSGEVGRRGDQDVVVVCTGLADDIELALGLVRPRGKIVLKTEPMPLPEPAGSGFRPIAPPSSRGADLTAVVMNEIEVVGARCGRVADAIGLLERGVLDPAPLITKRFKLDDGVAALRAASDPAALKVVIAP